MARLTFVLVCLLIFIIPAEEQFVIEEFESGTRMVGYVALFCAFFGMLAKGGMRPWSPTLTCFALFWAWSILTMGWTIDDASTLSRLVTYTGDALLVWLIWEFASTLQSQIILLWSFCLGVSFDVLEMYVAFLTGGQFTPEEERYTGGMANENELAYMGVLAICIAAFLAFRTQNRSRIAQLFVWGFIPVTGLGILLTGSRGGTVALVAAAGVLFLGVRRSGWGFRILFVAAVFLVVAFIPRLVPEKLMERITEGTESQTFKIRQDIWGLALQRWTESPILGYGAGTFKLAVWGPSGGRVSHNLYISVLVEDGIIGLAFYAGAALMTFYAVWHMPRADRPFWLAVLTAWFIGSMVSPWEYGKLTWFLLTTISALSRSLRSAASEQARTASQAPVVAVARSDRQPRLGAT